MLYDNLIIIQCALSVHYNTDQYGQARYDKAGTAILYMKSLHSIVTQISLLVLDYNVIMLCQCILKAIKTFHKVLSVHKVFMIFGVQGNKT